MDLNYFRQQIPQLNGLDDQSALDLLHKHYYPGVDKQRMADVLGVKAPAPPKPERSTIRAVGDLATQFAGGAVSGVRMMSDVFGADNAVSGGLRSAEEALSALQSAAAKADQQEIAAIMQEAEGKGWGEQIASGLKAFGVAPGAMMAQALGTSLPTLATAAIPGAGPTAVAARLGMAGAVGGAQGAGNIKGVIYEDVKRKLASDPTLTPEQIEARAVEAQSYGGENAGQIALGGGLGVLAGSTGMERAAAGLRNGVTKAAPGMLGRVGMGAATEAVPEALQGGQEKFASNTALANEGFDVDPWSGVVAQGTMEAAAGGLMGGAFGVPNPDVRTPQPTPGDQMRATEGVPEAGPMTRAANLATEQKAKAADATLQLGFNPLAGTPVVFPDGSVALGSEQADAKRSEDAQAANIKQMAARRPPMVASDAARILGEAKTRGLDFTAAPHPEGGFMVVPRNWVTPELAAEAEADLSGTLARMQQADAAPVQRAPRTRTEGQELSLPIDPVRNYVDGLRQVNTPATKLYVRDFDAGRITPADVQERMAAERGKTPDERLAAAAAEGLRMNPKGDPFKTMMAAQRAAKTTPGDVIEVQGGYAIRPQQKADDAPAAEQPSTEAQPPAADAAGSQPVPPAQGQDAGALKGGWTEFPQETGTLNVPRAEMPQVKTEHRGAMVNFLNARGVAHEQVEVDPASLKPTQAEFSQTKVQEAADRDTDRSILISSDGHIIDGHHQAIAKLQNGKPVRAIKLNATADELLPLVREFPSSTVDEATNVQNAPQPAAAAQAKTPAGEAPAPAGRDAAPASGVPATPGAGDVQADGVALAEPGDVSKNPPKIDTSAKPAQQAEGNEQVKKPPFASKEDVEHLFGVGVKRQKAIDRVNKGTAYFGTQEKAADFIKKGGIKDTHEAVQTKTGRFEVKAKAGSNMQTAYEAETQAPADPASRETRIATTLADGGKVVNGELRTRSGMGLMKLTPEEVSKVPSDKQDTPQAIKQRLDAVYPARDGATSGGRIYNPDGSYYNAPKETAIDRRNRLIAERKGVSQQKTEAQDGQYTLVGRNSDGKTIMADKRGVRSYSENGIRIEEAVSMRPVRGGGMELSIENRRDEFRTVEEVAADQPAAAPAPASPASSKTVATPSANTIFTEDAAAAARARLKAKLGRLNSGLDPEMMMDGITLAGYHIEKGARTFAAYARAMVGDLGDGVKPYLKSWYMGVKYDPRATAFAGMDGAAAVEAADVDALALETPTNQADTGAKENGNATRNLDRPSAGALEGAPSENVRAPDGSGSAGAGADGGSRGDRAGDARADDAGGNAAGSLGADPGAVPVPARGSRTNTKGAKKPRVPGPRGIDEGLGLFGGAGGLTPDTGANPAPNAPQIPAPQPTDFTITDELALGEGGQKTKFKNNIAAIRLVRELDASGRLATPDEQAVLAKYVGWGGLSQAFDPKNADWTKEHAEIKALMSPEELDAAARSTRYAHYTSREIIVDGIYAAMRHFGFTGGKTLEAGAGVGNFIGLMPADMRSAGRFTAIEREPFSSAIARNLYPQQSVQRADFTEFRGTDGYFDAAVGNPPFASDPQTDMSGRKHLSGLSLHNYFFGKSIDMLREGGIMAQVVTNSFLDAAGDRARKYMSDRVEFLGAIRLPNNAFSKNAGTEVTTDIVFLKKRPDSEVGTKAASADAKRWLNTGKYTDARGKVVALNQYFIDNPDMMLGDFGAYGTMYGPDQPALVARHGQDTLAMLKAAVAKLPAGVYQSIERTSANVNSAVVALKNPPVKEGGYFVDGNKLMQRLPDIAGEARGVEITPATLWTKKTTLGEAGFERIKALSAMRSTVRGLIAAEMADDADGMKALRATLNEQYDTYRDTHGLINDPSTLRVFDDDPDFPLLASLEHGYTPGIGLAAAKTMGIKPVKSTAKKGPIFTQRVVAARQAVQRVDSPADALAVSMAERGKLDTAYIGQLLGMEPAQVLQELSTGEKPLLFLDPATDEYVLRDAYLSGNVRAKLAQAKAAGMFTNVNALEEVQPVDVASHEITARLGSPWIPVQVYKDFARTLYGEDAQVNVTYLPNNSSYQLSIQGGGNVAMTNTWGTPDYPGDALLQAVMNNRTVKVTYRDSDGKTHTDGPATEKANEKAAEMRSKFTDWLFTDPDRSEVLTKAYNETNNNYVTRIYDGSNMTFPGKVPDAVIKFRRHQRNAIARIVQDRTALLDHVVGAGKTFTVIAAAMELKRTGLARKPMVAVPNHLVKQWAADFYRLYPGANILTATKKDFATGNRRKFVAKIATGDWDAVVIAHSSFGFIQPSPQFESEFNRREIAKIMATIKLVEDGDGDKPMKKRTVKQLEGMKERLENRIKALRDKPMDDLLDFEQIGVDQLFVDEAHLFKNLMYTTKMQGVAGLNDPTGSQRAYDMYVKTNQIMEKNGRGQGVVFATGTPVSNSLAEMYHMMRYLMPAQMKELGFESFDAWANTYANVEQVWMQAPSGDGFKAQNRMSNFVNTTELLRMFDQVSDTVTMNDIKKAYAEENNGAEFPLPKLKGGRRTPVSMDKSPAQDAYMEDIARRAKAIEQRKGPPKKGDDNILVVMSDARKAAMDIRLVDPDATERERGGRIDRSTDEVMARYRKYDSVKGTQIVFSDLGTPLKHAKKELAEYEALQARVLAGNADVAVSAALGNEAALETMEDAESAQAELDAKGPDWLDAVKAAMRGFSIYDDFKAALIEKGMPENEIAFIHDYNTDDQKASLFRKVNAGQIRVLLGSTAKLGAGTNVQERLVAEHHLDVPWRPSDVEQREGRIERQGNVLMTQWPDFEIEILAYVTKDTLDMRMWQVQETKLKMINQLRTRKVGREIDNAFEDMELSAGEMQAAATGDINLLKEIQLRNDVKKLEQRRRAFDGQRNDLLSRRRRNADMLRDLPAKVEKIEAEAKIAAQYLSDRYANRPPFKMNIDGKDFTDADEAAAVLRAKDEATEEFKALNGEVTTKKAPLLVTIDGEAVKNRAVMAEMLSNARGDRHPIAWTFNGETYRRRTVIANAIRQDVTNAVSDETRVELGILGPYAVAAEGATEKDGTLTLEVTLSRDGKVVMDNTLRGFDSAAVADGVVRVSENLIDSLVSEADYLQRLLDRTRKDGAELSKIDDLGDWPDQRKLDAAREAHKAVLALLKQKEKPAAQPAPGSTNLRQTGAPEANEADVVFSRGKPAAGVPRKDAQAIADAIRARWANAPEIVVAANMQDPAVPERVRQEDAKQRSQGASGEPEGFYYGGKVYIVAGALNRPADVVRVLFHEALGHAGLRGVFGESLTPILKQLAVLRRADVAAKASEYGLNMSIEAERLQAAEEVLAVMAQTKPELGYVQRAIAAIRAFLRKNVPGFGKMVLTDAEIINSFILPARRFVERGPGGGPRGGMPAPAFSRTDIRSSRANAGAAGVADQIRQFDVAGKTGNALAHYRGMSLQALGRRQLVDLYQQELPQLTEYDRLVQNMEAEKNDTGAEADGLARAWAGLDEKAMVGVGPAKLPIGPAKHPGMERKLAELMHDATLAKIDPQKDYQAGDDRAQWAALRAKYNALSPKAQALYVQARDMYATHYAKVRKAIAERIERSEMSDSQKKQTMARMDDDFFKKTKGVYFPLARFGSYVMVVKDAAGEVVNVSRAETLNEAETTRKQLQQVFPRDGGFNVSKVLKDAEFNPGRDAVGKGFMADLLNVLDKQGVDDALRDSVSQLYLASLPDLSWAKHGIHRKGTPGFSQDARRAFAQNMFHGARHLAKLRYADQLQSQLEAMDEHIKAYREIDEYDSVKAQQVADEMVKRHENLMNPKTNPLSTLLTSAGFVFYLGISPAAAMVNLSQTALVAYPIMGAKWGFGKASAALLRASKETVAAKNDISKVLQGDELEAYEKAVKDGTIDVTMAHDLAGISQGEDAKVTWALRPVMRAASFLFHHAERFNRQATFIASFRLAKEAGADNARAFEEAKKATYDGHFDYGAANRPRVMQGNVAKVVLLFKQYGQNMVYTLSRQAYLSMKGLTPADRAEARKQLSGILALHAAAAGALGLPLVGALLGAASFIGGDDDEPWDAEVALKNAMAEAMGPKAAEVMAHGLSRLTPWDLSGRVALNKLILPDVREGLEGQDYAEAMMIAAIGPVGGIFTGVVKGAQSMLDGKYGRGFEEMLPVALRNPIKAMRYAEEGAVDKSGVVIKDEVSLSGVLGQASGFAPSEVRLATEGKSAIYQYDKARMDRRKTLVAQFAQAQMAGDTEGMAEVRQDIERFNNKNPTRRITPLNLMQSVRARQRRIDGAEQGVYLPKNRRDAMEAGRFAADAAL